MGPLPSFVVAAAVSAFVVALALRSPLSRLLLDVASARSLHCRPTPRVGGIGVMAGSLPLIFVAGDPGLRLVALLALVIGLVSLRDDWRPLPAGLRLLAHFGAAAGAVLSWLPVPFVGGVAAATLALTVAVGIVWMTNLFNFMDGADGLAGGMAVIGFGAHGVAALFSHDAALATACFALSGASLAFVAFNFPPARVFLGDAGSIPMGYLSGALGGLGVLRGVWPAWFPLLVFSPFIVDATVTLVRRAWRGEALMQAHRSHHYQALVLSGWSHRRLALAAWALMVCVAASALVALQEPSGVAVAIIWSWLMIYAALCTGVWRHARK